MTGHDHNFMLQALDEARKALEAGEVPVGALIVRDGSVIARGHNAPIARHDPTAHAEIIVMRQAAGRDGNYRLPLDTLYVTLEPCLMCVGAIVHARLSRVVFGADDPKGGAVRSVYRIFEDGKINHVPRITGGVLAEACGEIMSGFFRRKRI